MTGVVLPGFCVVVAGLLGLGPVAWVGGVWLAPRGALALCGLGTVLALLALLGGPPSAVSRSAVLEVPIGLPGSGILFAVDGVSALFLLLLCVAGAATAAAAIGQRDGPGLALLPVLLGTLAATLLAADGFSLVLGFAASALAVAALLAFAAPGWRPAPPLLAGGVFGTLGLVAAMALLAPLQPWGLDLSFAGMRSAPTLGAGAGVGAGVGAAAVFVLALPGAGGAAGIAPLHRWLPTAQASVAGPAGALLSGMAGPVGLYLLIRVLLDLAGPSAPGWWGGTLAVLGAAGAVLAAMRAARAPDIRTVAGAAAAHGSGLAVLALGLALAARAADLAPLAAFALAAALLLAVAQALGGTLLALAMAVAEDGAGTRRLDRLGGLLRGMPATTLAALVAALGTAALPPSLGFAALWTLIQALIGATRAGGPGWQGPGWQGLVAAALLAAALAGTLGAVAAVRLIGIGFLGRPRTPPAAAAREAPLPARIAMLALAAAALLAGAAPGPALWAAAPALQLLLGEDLGGRAGALWVAPMEGAPGLHAAALAALLLLAIAVVLRALRLRAGIGQRAGMAWEDGAAPPPPWLAFGDPATQAGPGGFAIPAGPAGFAIPAGPAGFAIPAGNLPPIRPWLKAWLRPMLHHRRRLGSWMERGLAASGRGGSAALLAAAVVLLLAAALAGPG